MKNNLKALKKISAIAILLLFSISSLSFVNAQTILDDALADSGDTFQILAPAPGEKVSGSIRVRFNIADDDSNNVQYFSSIYDSASCTNTNFGQISPTSTVSGNNFLWNTKATSATSNLADGTYCLKICVAFLNGTSPYTACNGRLVNILNNNSKPVITSTPPRLNFTEGESFNYQVVATDPNSDPLEYRFETTAPFLSINKNTGLITGQPMTVPADATIGGLKYTITVVVDDNKSGAVKQTFEITVLKKVVVPPPTQTPVPNPVPTPTPTPTPTPVPPTQVPEENKLVFEFIEPKKDTIIKDDSFLIKWKLSGVSPKNLSLEYSKDGVEWEVIQNNIDKTKDSFTWNTDERNDSDYFIRMKIELNNGQIVYKQSEKFKVLKSEDPELESEPLIIDQKPETNSEIAELRPEISATFLPSNDQETNLDSVEISLDGKNIKDKCEINITGFKCLLDSDLEYGKHLVKVSFKDSSDQKAEVEWSFIVKDPTSTGNESPSNSDKSNSNTVIILGREVPRSAAILIGIICCLGTLLIIIPWILYILWSRRTTKTVTIETYGKKDGGDLDSTVTVNTYDPYADLDSNFLSSYTVPAQTPNLGNPITEPTSTSATYYPENKPTSNTTNFITPNYDVPSYTPPDTTSTTSTTNYITPDYTVSDYSVPTDSTTTSTTDSTTNYLTPTYQIPGYNPTTSTSSTTTDSTTSTDYSIPTYTQPENNQTSNSEFMANTNATTNTNYDSNFDANQAASAPQTQNAAPVEPINYNEKYALPDYLQPYVDGTNTSTTKTTTNTNYVEPTATS